MPTLVLVKHAPPEVAPQVASPRWVLSAEGQRRCPWLGSELRKLGVRRLYASLEPKALETAALAGLPLGLPVRPRTGLQENDRTGLGFVAMEELRALIGRFFAEPEAAVMGAETGVAALARFEAAVRAAVAEAPAETAAIVTHGTVLTTLVTRYNAIAAFDFWDSLTLPAVVTLDAVSMRLRGPVRGFPKANG